MAESEYESDRMIRDYEKRGCGTALFLCLLLRRGIGGRKRKKRCKKELWFKVRQVNQSIIMFHIGQEPI